MFFRKIALENFKSHTSTTLELQKLTVIRGLNGAGKSSIRDAFQILLAGRTEATTADGKGSSALIRAGQTKAHITLAARQDGEERILRCGLKGGERNVIVAKPGDPTYSGGEEWMKWLEMHRATLNCLIDGNYFVGLSADKQADILSAIVLPKTYDWPEWVRKSCFDCELKLNWAKTPFEIIEQAYKLAYDERRDINRDLKNFKMPDGDTTGADDLEELSHRLGERRTELQALITRKATIEAEAKTNVKLRETAAERLNQAQQRLNVESRNIEELESRILSAAKRKEYEKTAKSAKRAAELDADIARIVAELGVKKAALARFNELAKNPACPTCSTPLTEETVAAIAGPLIEERNRLQEQHTTLLDERKKLGNIDEATKALADEQQAKSDIERARQRAKDEQTIIADAEAKIEELKAAEKTDIFSQPLADEIAQVQDAVNKGTEAVRIAQAAKELKGRIEAARVEHAKLVRRQGELEKLVAYFGEEVRNQLLADSIGTFTQAMNDVLAGWGYSCTISIEPYVFAIHFTDAEAKQHDIPLAMLSRSQRYRFATAFQVALAIVTGFRFVIVDEAEILDSRNRGPLFQALTSGELDQAIILITDEREQAPSMEGAIYWRLDDVAEAGMLPRTEARKLVAA